MKDLNIDKKILIIPIISALLLVIIAISFFMASSQVRDKTQNLVEVRMHTIIINQQTISELKNINGQMYEIFNLKSAGFNENNLRNIKKSLNNNIINFDNNLNDALNDPNIDEASKTDYKEIKKLYKEYRRTAIDSLELMDFSESTGFMLFYGIKDIYNNMSTTIQNNINKSNALGKEAYEDSMNKIKMTMTSLVILIIFSIAISAFVGFKVTKSIKKPLLDLKDGLSEFFEYLSHKRDDVKTITIYGNDEIGSMSKDINTNIHKIKSNLDKDTNMINDLISCVSSVNDGHLNIEIAEEPHQKELKRVKNFFNSMLKTLEQSIGKEINTILETLDNYKAHNYNRVINDANGTVELAVNDLGDTIRKMLSGNLETGNTLKDKASTLFSNIDMLEENMTKQKSLVDDSSKQLEIITTYLLEQVINSSKMASYSDEVTTSANSGTSLANKTTQAMENMDTMVDEINRSIEIIDKIVVKTNILSLNASVEAVSAGEAGKGFGVVAKEVRNLANQSANASSEIKKIVNEAKEKADEGKQIVSDMMKGYNGLLLSIENSTVLINESISISNKQEKSILHISDIVKLLDQQSTKTSTIAKETQSIANQTNTIAQKIVNDVKEHSF